MKIKQLLVVAKVLVTVLLKIVLVLVVLVLLLMERAEVLVDPARKSEQAKEPSRDMQPNEIHKFIKDLQKHRPDYLAEAKKRADDLTSRGWVVRCPICDTQLSILHVFPQLTLNVDTMIDTDWHVKCGNCGHEDLFTMMYKQD